MWLLHTLSHTHTHTHIHTHTAAQSEAGERDVEVLREEQQGEERAKEEHTETKERDDKPQVEESSLPPSQSPPHTSQEALGTVPHEPPPPPAILEQDNAKQELTQILIEAFYRYSNNCEFFNAFIYIHYLKL